MNLDFLNGPLFLVVSADQTKILLPPVQTKKQAVQMANFLRQLGFKCHVKNPLSFCAWVEIEINCQI